ncbi:zinc finger protein 37 [Triplophysa rosa]|uniref:B-cell CLL/lymphoma 6 member B protein n=1 Tax=Triplophysa rosa TaxID=992332 RepID=A0A9W7X242_TRIRA|nr:zinc finger protein 37 [Triplophysa rosa]KAI7812722.1 putative B-cell CLL/lymphoma 6 member B protein [Triplophysa rosa]
MNSKRNNGENGSGRINQGSVPTNSASASVSHRKQTIINKTEKAECMQSVTRDKNMSISTLRTRLGPTIRSTLSSAVDTLLVEIVAVLSETQRELLTKEQENEKLKIRLEVSERELKTLQECLCSAQKLIDQLQGPFNPPMTGHHAYNTGGPVNSSRLTHRSAPQTDPRCFTGGEAELSGALGDAIHGFDSREDFKSCHLSIQADGTVTNSFYDPISVHSSNICSDMNRTGEMVDDSRRLSHNRAPNPPSLASFSIKEEQGLVSGQMCVRAREPPTETEHSAQSSCDLAFVHVAEEGSSSSHHHPSKNTAPPPSSRPHNGPSSSSSPPQGTPGLRSAPRDTPSLGMSSKRSPGAGGSSPEQPARRSISELMGEVPGERPHLCLECGKTFRLISSLKKHLRIHTGEKPYPCTVCGRRFRESGALKTHLRIHTGEKPYSCSECGTQFRHLDGLRKHRRTHTGEKPYVCSVCGKRLSRLQHLKHHQRIHTGERPCCCPLCHRGFKDPASLRKHLRAHQGEPGADEAMGMISLGEADGASIDDEDMRFGMWGEEEGNEAESVVDCV